MFTGFGSLRLVVGLICVVISFVLFDFLTKVIYWAINRTKLSFRNTNAKGRVASIDLCIKYLTYAVISGHITFSIPILFEYLHIGRASYYEE